MSEGRKKTSLLKRFFKRNTAVHHYTCSVCGHTWIVKTKLTPGMEEHRGKARFVAEGGPNGPCPRCRWLSEVSEKEPCQGCGGTGWMHVSGPLKGVPAPTPSYHQILMMTLRKHSKKEEAALPYKKPESRPVDPFPPGDEGEDLVGGNLPKPDPKNQEDTGGEYRKPLDIES